MEEGWRLDISLYENVPDTHLVPVVEAPTPPSYIFSGTEGQTFDMNHTCAWPAGSRSQNGFV